MSARPSRLLFVVFIVLLGTAYFVSFQQRRESQVTLPTPMPEVFPGIVATQISHIEIENVQDRRKVKLTKVPGDWQATDEKGSPIAVDYRQVSRILDRLPNLRYRRIMEGTDVKTFGLDNGGFFIVRFNAGRSYTLRVGDLTSDQMLVYVQRDSNPQVLQVPADELYTLIALVRPT
jgi:hypothetical protein